MDLHISLVGRTDLSGEIYRQIRQAMLEGRLRPGDRIPPTRELARSLSVSRTTVTVAYERLTAQGFVASRIGAGTFVSEHAATTPGHAGRRIISALRPRSIWSGVPDTATPERSVPFDFRTGVPDASLFPFESWRRLISRQLRLTAVGTGSFAEPAGHRGLREAIVRHLGLARAVPASPDHITVTNGVQQALDVIARAIVGPGDRVAVEDPGYRPSRMLFASMGARVQGVPVDRDGLVVEALHPRTRLVYVTPSHQYPLGVSMSLARRRALLEWAERHNAAIVEDDYDSEFRFGGRPIEPLRGLDATGRVLYVASFSKTMLPTLRVGFALTPPSLTGAVRAAKLVSDWHTSLPIQAALATFLDDGGYARHVRKMQKVYRERHEIVTDLITGELADHLELIPSATGLHIAVLARSASAEQVQATLARASEEGVEVDELASLCVDTEPMAGLLIGYGGIATGHIAEGLRLLGTCFDRSRPG